MNENHARLCGSPEWAKRIQTEILPWVTEGADLGHELLEVGPGPGAATEWLYRRVKRLVALEYEEEAANTLSTRFAGTNVEVVHGDATAMTFPDNSFDSADSFTMLHHVPTPALQNKLLSEVLRVLRPDGGSSGPTASRVKTCITSTTETRITRSTRVGFSAVFRRSATPGSRFVPSGP